jgi:hypothetical protein
MSRLEPADAEEGVASFDGASAAIEAQPYTAIPEAGGPTALGQTGPFVMTGMQWLTGPLAGEAPEPANEFTAMLKGAKRVRLGLRRMAIDVAKPVDGTVESDQPLALELRARWGGGTPTVLVDGQPQAVTRERQVVTVELPAGRSRLELEPAAQP